MLRAVQKRKWQSSRLLNQIVGNSFVSVVLSGSALSTPEI